MERGDPFGTSLDRGGAHPSLGRDFAYRKQRRGSYVGEVKAL